MNDEQTDAIWSTVLSRLAESGAVEEQDLSQFDSGAVEGSLDIMQERDLIEWDEDQEAWTPGDLFEGLQERAGESDGSYELG